VGVPLLTYFAMRKLDRFNPLVFGTVSMGAILLALQLLGGNLVESFLNALGSGRAHPRAWLRSTSSTEPSGRTSRQRARPKR